ncbi:hypothetical protein [Marinilabilia salmonicolor]|jgi:hypothetical protein|uniref:Uncharacterized protein n=1 Tax=Marinilabilia salmonicolor TaxID=989 RepID=A0A368VAW7_9BACT|nr:hypothetical protein [Marinilabilia salmonicolor]RCW36804.1 hypothetical protein DFO77_10795 [Marinilabilia salmonicolor]
MLEIEKDSTLRRPFRAMPYDPEWRCARCGGKVLESYSGSIIWGKLIVKEKVAYRFLLEISDKKVTFLDQHHIYKKEINDKQRQAFYNIIENLSLWNLSLTNQQTWQFHLTYPSKNELISFTGGINNGKDILKKAIEELGFRAEFPEQGK